MMDTLLSPKQQKIYLKLLKLDIKAAEAYRGALKVLRDRENPDRFSQSANSLREVTDLISRKVAIPQEAKQDTLKKKLEKQFVEKPELLPSPAGEKTRTLIREWGELHANFFTAIAHHGKEVGEEEFSSKLSVFESILVQFLKPTPETLEELDSLLVVQSPMREDIRKLAELLIHPTHVDYFFSRLTWLDWLLPLKEHRFFSEPPEGLEEGGYILFPAWPLSKYLIKIAGQRPREVMDIIKSMKETHNFRVHIALIDCALQMPSSISKEIIPLMKKWMITPHLQFIPEKFGNLVIKLNNEREAESALDLLETILDVDHQDRRSDIPLREAQPHFNLWAYKQILNKVVTVILESQPREVIEILLRKLSKAIELERPGERSHYGDYSHVWRPAIENHTQNREDRDVKDLLVSAIRDSLETIQKSNAEKFRSCYRLLSEFKYAIFRRMELHFMRMFPDLLKEEIQNSLSNRTNSEDVRVWHEYYHLLREQYSELPENLKGNILNWVEEGPDLERFESWYKEKRGMLPTKEEKDAYKASWQMGYLSAIKDFIPPKWKERWNELIARYGEPEHPDFHVYIGPVSWGSKSPLTKEEIRTKSLQELISYLRTWKPSKDFLAPSREALGGIMSEIVSEDPSHYIEICQELKTLFPVYIYSFIEGFTKAIKKENSFDWKPVISSCRDVLITPEQARILRETNADHDWKSVKRGITDLLKEGLDSKIAAPPSELREAIWELVEILLQDDEPNLAFEKEYGGENMDPVTLSLNTVRGKAMHVLIHYALWCARCLNLSKNEDRMVPEVKEQLENMLNPEFEPTKTVRAAYGLYLPNLFYLNKVWAQEHISNIFPKDAEYRPLWRAAWEAYVVYCSLFIDVYKEIRDQYRIALDKLDSPKITTNAKEKLSEHLMVIYLWQIEGLENGSPINAFFRKAQPEIRRRAIWFIGRTLEQVPKSDLDKERKDRIIKRSMDLWEWRTQETKRVDRQTRDKSVQELKWFGMWFVHSPFDKAWAITQLDKTLELTEGEIEFADDVIDSFRNYIEKHSLEVLKALTLLVKGDKRGLLVSMSKERIRELIETIIKEHPTEETMNSVNELVDCITRRGHHEFAIFFRK